jgi:hypothetical protein
MPGPVSDSLPTPKDSRIKDAWRAEIRARGFRYFVLKADDVFAALSERDIKSFDRMLHKIEDSRQRRGKPISRAYWIFARHWRGAAAVKELIESLLGCQIGEPY